MRYWDSSALFAIFVQQACSKVAEGWLRADLEIAAWTLTPIEITSALARLVREGVLDTQDIAKVESRLERRLRRAVLISNVDEIKLVAQRVLHLHPLRAADALQLAAALMWVNHRPMRKLFLTFDVRLAEAAYKEGFTVPKN